MGRIRFLTMAELLMIYETMMALAAGEMSKEGLTRFFKRHSRDR